MFAKWEKIATIIFKSYCWTLIDSLCRKWLFSHAENQSILFLKDLLCTKHFMKLCVTNQLSKIKEGAFWFRVVSSGYEVNLLIPFTHSPLLIGKLLTSGSKKWQKTIKFSRSKTEWKRKFSKLQVTRCK